MYASLATNHSPLYSTAPVLEIISSAYRSDRSRGYASELSARTCAPSQNSLPLVSLERVMNLGKSHRNADSTVRLGSLTISVSCIPKPFLIEFITSSSFTHFLPWG